MRYIAPGACILFFLLAPASSSAQEINISGKVYELIPTDWMGKEIKRPVKGVVVIAYDVHAREELTSPPSDENGHYSLPGLEKRKYKIYVEDLKFQSWKRNIDLSNGAARTLNIPLRRINNSARAKNNCTVPNYDDLCKKTRDMLFDLNIRAGNWNILNAKQRLVVLNLIAAAREKLTLYPMRVYWAPGKGILKDRIFFLSATGVHDQVIKSPFFAVDIGKGKSHGRFNDSYRRNRLYKSAQLSFTDDIPDKLEIDIDVFNPNLNVSFGLGLILHFFEVQMMHSVSRKMGWPGQTNPYSVSQDNWECLENRKCK